MEHAKWNVGAHYAVGTLVDIGDAVGRVPEKPAAIPLQVRVWLIRGRIDSMATEERSTADMSDETPSVMTFYSGWSSFQKGLAAMIAPLSREQLALPTGSHHWPIGLVVQHLVGNRVWWFHHWMGEGNSELAPLAHWDPSDEVEQLPLDAAELVVGLEMTWQLVADSLSRWTAADLPKTFSPPAVMSEEERSMFGDLSRQWIIWHVLEHEILHTGELSLSLGGYGLPGFYGDI